MQLTNQIFAVMIFITEESIEKYIIKYENQNDYVEDLHILYKDQQDLIAFIDKENHTLLTEDELVLLQFLTMIIYFSTKDQLKMTPILLGKDIEDAEEHNWTIFNDTNNKSFAQILDVFFESYHQEDLLALIEDSLQPDEDNPITPIGKEIIFIACKSIIDALDNLND